MHLLVNQLKLKAAIRSMHQFCPIVRTIFPDLVDDRVVEATVSLLYQRIADDVYGRRFAVALEAGLRDVYKFSGWIDVEDRIARIVHNISIFETHTQSLDPSLDVSEDFTRHVRSVIRAILLEAHGPWDDTNVVRHTYPRFENAARRIKAHLEGIRKQPKFVMK